MARLGISPLCQEPNASKHPFGHGPIISQICEHILKSIAFIHLGPPKWTQTAYADGVTEIVCRKL